MTIEPGKKCTLDVSLKEFIQLQKSLRVGKKLGKRNREREEAVFGFDSGQLTVEAVGARRSIPAAGHWSGFARISFMHFDALKQAPPSQDPLQIKGSSKN